MPEAVDLFISYARADESLRAELETHLALLKRQGVIRPWHQREVVPGDEWQEQVDDRLEAADVILLLVSASFLASDDFGDVETALECHRRGDARVIPIIVRPCDWQTSRFARLQALPRDGRAVTTWANRDEAWLDVVVGLRAAIAAFDRAPRPDTTEQRQDRERQRQPAPRHAAPAGMEPRPRSHMVPAGAWEAYDFDPAESAGLFVGVSDFEDPRFTPVRFAVDDAVDLADLFVSELGLITPTKVVLGLAGNPRKSDSKRRLQILRDAGASVTSARQVDVYARLDRQRKAAGAGGLFLAAFATHGFSDQGGDFLVAADSLRRRIVRTGVAVNELFDDVARSRCSRRLVLLDACRERLSADTRGGTEPQAAMSPSFAEAIAQASGQAVLTGTAIGGYSYDDLDRGNGVFTGAVLDGLRGQAPVDERGFITVRTLADFVNQQVVEWVRDQDLDHAGAGQGIESHLAGEASMLPLAKPR